MTVKILFVFHFCMWLTAPGSGNNAWQPGLGSCLLIEVEEVAAARELTWTRSTPRNNAVNKFEGKQNQKTRWPGSQKSATAVKSTCFLLILNHFIHMLHSGTWRKLQTLAEGHIDVWSQHNTRLLLVGTRMQRGRSSGRGEVKKLRAMETYKKTKKSLPVATMLVSVQKQCWLLKQ